LAKVGMAILMLLMLYTFGENLEILAYLFWPGLIILGKALIDPPTAPSHLVDTKQ
jgi:hypothetical protein